MQTAYDVLNTLSKEQVLTAEEYNKLVEDFQLSFLRNRNYQENLSEHRKPRQYKQEVLQEVYDLITKIQGRPELQDYDPSKNAHGYAHIRVQWLWEKNKSLRSIYNAARKYCEMSGKDFNITLVHIAEYRALILLMKKLNRSIYHIPKAAIIRFELKEKTTTTRKSVSARLRRELQKEGGSICPFCGNSDVAIHEVHHIDMNPSNNAFENLIHVCGNCHSKISAGIISLEMVIHTKQKLLTLKI